ncbi:MAG: FdtA/QdtA family cupin domain-containing protein [Bacteroidota bacterium]|nr:FdtA/QdtA family cupin domain-containing protein [Bacteroidota bacterium]MDP3144999.1 FdtA/QdtA family cupin domain-containing protein [Bacteroidota bacterium]MDP3556031.1 FdtA/QdtA family cupin domain-containing protein [Bacteroidota bacterium]
MSVKILDFPKILDPRGNLTFLQNPTHIPFEIKRVFWLYDVPGGELRGGHAYKKQDEVIIALSGSFDVIITQPDGTKEKFSLNRSYYGLFVPALTWRHIENFSTNSVGFHLSSLEYNDDDYIRNFETFKNRVL